MFCFYFLFFRLEFLLSVYCKYSKYFSNFHFFFSLSQLIVFRKWWSSELTYIFSGNMIYLTIEVKIVDGKADQICKNHWNSNSKLVFFFAKFRYSHQMATLFFRFLPKQLRLFITMVFVNAIHAMLFFCWCARQTLLFRRYSSIFFEQNECTDIHIV